MQGELIALNVPRGSGYDSQSGLNNLFLWYRVSLDYSGPQIP
jgi:hypothetical protein